MPAVSRLSSPDGAMTLMLSDIADAEAMAAELGPERWERLLRDHHSLVEFEQDGFLASFSSAHGGLHAAVELQRTFEDAPLRIGMHSGFLITSSDQLLGRNVVLAARIGAMAEAGAILVSSSLKEYTETDPSFDFELRGEFRFKGLLGDHVVYEVRWQVASPGPRR